MMRKQFRNAFPILDFYDFYLELSKSTRLTGT